MIAKLREDAQAAWLAGVRAVRPEDCVRRALEARGDLTAGSTLIVSVGKAASGMLRGALEHAGNTASPSRAIALVPEGADVGELPGSAIVLRGGHPHPTAASFASTRKIIAEVDLLGPGERLLFLLSGGASALLEAPAPGLTEGDLARAHATLVESGLPIRAINLVRGCISAVKAGGLAARARPAATITFAISDVEGDDPDVIGSAPTRRPQQSFAARCREALELLARSAATLPEPVIGLLERGRKEATVERDAAPDGARDFTVVASIRDAVEGARRELAARGYLTTSGDAYLRGQTSETAAFIRDATLAGHASANGPRAFVFGGETTVAVTASRPGRGGRNLDLAARLALSFEGEERIAVVVAGTDGRDGSSRAAGAVVDGATAVRARRAGHPLEDALSAFDTEPAIECAGDLLVTGPTGTNVGDLVVTVAG